MNVYIVPHASEPRFKIGKANDSLARLAHFEKKNDLDFSKAFVLELESEQRAFEVERSLHLLFADDRLEGDPDAWGDGFSEWFSMRSFVRALDKADRLREKIKAQRGREMTPRDIVQSIWAIKTTSEAKQLLGLCLQRQKGELGAA